MSSSDSSLPAHKTIAIDCMGGDHGVNSTLPGAVLALKEDPEIRYLLFGHQDNIQPFLDKNPAFAKASELIHTDKMIKGDEKPSDALRKSKGSSLRMAIEAVKEGRAQAIVSSGNTGALMATAKVVLKTLPGIHRPALASVFPGIKGDTVMLDLGANVLVDAQNLVQFAVLGSAFACAHKGITAPSVGLLNVGTEETKGPDHVRAAATLLADVKLPGQYIGFVEGTDITKNTADVIVSDGYAGNIALKSGEGVGSMSKTLFTEAMTSGPLAMIGGAFAYGALKRMKSKIDPRRYNGGVFLGLNGICIKSHGGCDDYAFSRAIIMASKLVDHGYVERVSEDIIRLSEQETLLS